MNFTLMISSLYIILISINLKYCDTFNHGAKNEVGSCLNFLIINNLDRCEPNRNDSYWINHHDGVCYCDKFCDSTKNSPINPDCCSDANTVCHDTSKPSPTLKKSDRVESKHGFRSNKGSCKEYLRINGLKKCSGVENRNYFMYDGKNGVCFCDAQCDRSLHSESKAVCCNDADDVCYNATGSDVKLHPTYELNILRNKSYEPSIKFKKFKKFIFNN
jgi:hypothetical protein